MKNLLTRQRAQAIIIVLCILIFFLIETRVFFTNQINLEETEYVAIETQTQEIEIENYLLKEQVLDMESYTRIASEAASRGFVPAQVVDLQ